ncbi:MULTISPECIES: transporter [Pseudomonas]|uniref:transporter n=1 Tax=Pseudomonas TaxID=286 RepID=UPI0006B51D6D|nr:transporter [Pseudomonas fuscovaginae]KPA99015.1 putative MetA-pathway of phenol degradation [Pseudomonas fuscovaginae]
MICNSQHFQKMYFFLFLIAPFAYGDNIKLKSGDRYSGNIISYTNGICVFDTRYGAAIRIPTAEIESIATDTQYHVEFSSGEKVIGQLKTDSAGLTSINSQTFGTSPIAIGSISRIVKSFSHTETEQRVKAGEGAKGNEQKEYGAETENQAPLDFLTGSTVLLSPGKVELDLSSTYKQSRTQYSLPAAGYFQKSSYSARQLELRPTIRAGLYEGVEVYASVPMTYSRVQDVSSNEYIRSTSSWDMADISFGGQYQLTQETESTPAISATFDVSAPTGRKKYNSFSDSWKDPLNNGSGHWSVAPGLAFVRSTDPAILFGGFNYQYFFANKVDGYDVQPGWVVNTYFGVGFALNERLSLGSRFSYSYSSNMKAEHETIYGSDSDPMDITLNVSYRLSESWLISPSITYGLNNDSGPAALSISLKKNLN